MCVLPQAASWLRSLPLLLMAVEVQLSQLLGDITLTPGWEVQCCQEVR